MMARKLWQWFLDLTSDVEIKLYIWNKVHVWSMERRK